MFIAGYEGSLYSLVTVTKNHSSRKFKEEDVIEVKGYCSNVDMELTVWKAKIFDAIRKADQLGSADPEKVLPNIQDLLHTFRS